MGRWDVPDAPVPRRSTFAGCQQCAAVARGLGDQNERRVAVMWQRTYGPRSYLDRAGCVEHTHTEREREREREIERQLRVWPEVTRGAHHSTKRLLIRALHLHTTCVHLGGGVGGSGGGGIPSIIPSISGSNLKIRGCVFFQFKKWICSYWYCRSQINVLVPVEDFGFVLCCSKRIWNIQCLRPKINQSILPRIPSIFGFYLRMREN